jgi:amidase
MTTWLTQLDTCGNGPGLAVKDCIDVRGVPTTVGCQVIAENAVPARHDAPVVAMARKSGARILGKTNLTELCWSAGGINPWWGTPQNPAAPGRVPGGSSSGSAVAVATGEADVALGTDTGGSVRIPAACCGVGGLKTTWGRVPMHGVYPLAPSLDTVGPIGANIAAIELGMRLIEPGFDAGSFSGPLLAGRLRPAVDIAPEVDAAVDRALAAAGFVTEDVPTPNFAEAYSAANVIIDGEGYCSNAHLLRYVRRLSPHVQLKIERGAQVGASDLGAARGTRELVQSSLIALLRHYPVLALPTLAGPPPFTENRYGHAEVDGRGVPLTMLTIPASLAGLPALALPVEGAGGLPASLQLIGPVDGEERLIVIGRLIETAMASMRVLRNDLLRPPARLTIRASGSGTHCHDYFPIALKRVTGMGCQDVVNKKHIAGLPVKPNGFFPVGQPEYLYNVRLDRGARAVCCIGGYRAVRQQPHCVANCLRFDSRYIEIYCRVKPCPLRGDGMIDDRRSRLVRV